MKSCPASDLIIPHSDLIFALLKDFLNKYSLALPFGNSQQAFLMHICKRIFKFSVQVFSDDQLQS
jgi:hypothetical protein